MRNVEIAVKAGGYTRRGGKNKSIFGERQTTNLKIIAPPGHSNACSLRLVNRDGQARTLSAN